MNKLSFIFATILFFAGATVANAEGDDNTTAQHTVGITIPTVALLDIENSDGEASSITLEPEISSLEAGQKIDFTSVSDNSLWLNYTSIISASSSTSSNTSTTERTINVKLGENSLPGGISLTLTVGDITTGKGNRGTEASGITTLSASNQAVVTGIGSCYTESGANKGHQLTYGLSMEEESYDELNAGTTYSATVIYTITE